MLFLNKRCRKKKKRYWLLEKPCYNPFSLNERATEKNRLSKKRNQVCSALWKKTLKKILKRSWQTKDKWYTCRARNEKNNFEQVVDLSKGKELKIWFYWDFRSLKKRERERTSVWAHQVEELCEKKQNRRNFLFEGFDPGSERTVAACLFHASRARSSFGNGERRKGE